MQDMQNNIERLKERIRSGELTTAQANVEMVRMERFRLIRNRLSRDLRAALNEAVKRGELGHMKKDGHKPEVYFHPTFEYLANAARAEAVQAVHNALSRYAGFPAA